MPRPIRLLSVCASAAALAVLASGAVAAPSSSRIVKGIYDEAAVYGNPEATFPVLKRLGTKAIRVNLYWGGRLGASKARPARLDPDDARAFDWGLYDRAVRLAARNGIKVYFSVYGTPPWANRRKGLNVPPTRIKDLENFVFLAQTRYSGRYVTDDGERLPAVRHWIAWNEPNNPVFLKRQFRKNARGKWVMQSAADYARICNAVVRGIRRAQVEWRIPRGQVACGVTAPRGNNAPRSRRPSVSPIPFVRAMKAAGARGFDAYAHHPYYGRPSETPASTPSRQAVTLGNIGDLIREVTRLWGPRRIWITEYGYQTNPPDRIFGVTPRLQARYMAQAFRLAKRQPRIDAFFWFLLQDERRAAGWQSGLITVRGARKPSFSTFRALR